mmetsp:Transcript_85418/g.238418  ORF Transcript_85418/g.238418 Transcript_85418/m.238418 type:complete len:351 (-) Transcript_85418:425-1477(-)
MALVAGPAARLIASLECFSFLAWVVHRMSPLRSSSPTSSSSSWAASSSSSSSSCASALALALRPDSSALSDSSSDVPFELLLTPDNFDKVLVLCRLLSARYCCSICAKVVARIFFMPSPMPNQRYRLRLFAIFLMASLLLPFACSLRMMYSSATVRSTSLLCAKANAATLALVVGSAATPLFGTCPRSVPRFVPSVSDAFGLLRSVEGSDPPCIVADLCKRGLSFSGSSLYLCIMVRPQSVPRSRFSASALAFAASASVVRPAKSLTTSITAFNLVEIMCSLPPCLCIRMYSCAKFPAATFKFFVNLSASLCKVAKACFRCSDDNANFRCFSFISSSFSLMGPKRCLNSL